MPRVDKDTFIQEMLAAHAHNVATAPPQPDSVEWWRQVAQGLSVECHKIKATLAAQQAELFECRERIKAEGK
jgi:hypothetical protein